MGEFALPPRSRISIEPAKHRSGVIAPIFGRGIRAVEASRAVVDRMASGSRRGEDPLARRAEEARYATLSNRFRSVAALAPDEEAMLYRLDHGERRIHQAGSELVREGDPAPAPMYVVSGWAARLRVLSGGRRQILNLILPSDGIGLHGSAEPVSGFSVWALTTVETVDARQFLDRANNIQCYPGLAHAIHRAAVQEECFVTNQILRLGAQNKTERVANLLMELRWRLDRAGLADGALFPLPLTAESLADALGMKAAEVRHAMQHLKFRGAVAIRYGRARILSETRARDLAEFRPPESCANVTPKLSPFTPAI